MQIDLTSDRFSERVALSHGPPILTVNLPFVETKQLVSLLPVCSHGSVQTRC